MEQLNRGRNLSGTFEAEYSSGFHRGANKLVKRNIILLFRIIDRLKV